MNQIIYSVRKVVRESSDRPWGARYLLLASGPFQGLISENTFISQLLTQTAALLASSSFFFLNKYNSVRKVQENWLSEEIHVFHPSP